MKINVNRCEMSAASGDHGLTFIMGAVLISDTRGAVFTFLIDFAHLY